MSIWVGFLSVLGLALSVLPSFVSKLRCFHTRVFQSGSGFSVTLTVVASCMAGCVQRSCTSAAVHILLKRVDMRRYCGSLVSAAYMCFLSRAPMDRLCGKQEYALQLGTFYFHWLRS